MSNPAVITLADGYIGETIHVRIEDNLGESIHIHVDNTTFYFTVKEFEDFVNALTKAVKELLSYHSINLDDFDFSAFDWGWLRKYHRIKSISIENVYLSDLYTMNLIEEKKEKYWKYVKIEESHNYKALLGNTDVLNQYNLQNLYGENNIGRLYNIVDSIKKNGYPYRDKLIIVNQYGIICDGAHRAASLLYIYGKEKRIPVKMVSFEGEETVEEYNARAVKCYKDKRKKEILHKAIRIGKRLRKISERNTCSKKRDETLALGKHNNKNITLEAFLTLLNNKNIRAFILDKPKYSNADIKIADLSVIIDEDDFNTFLLEMNNIDVVADKNYPYQKYRMLYSVDRPILYNLADKKILVFSRICCKSFDEDALLPVDTYIMNQCWHSLEYCEMGLPKANKIMTTLCVILDSLLEQKCFFQFDKEYIKNNKKLLYSKELITALNLEFFKFSPLLLELLKEEKFDNIVCEYLHFRDY